MKSYKKSVKTILRTSNLVAVALVAAIQLISATTTIAAPVVAGASVSTRTLGGGKIAFDSMRSGGHDIYIMNANGSNQTRLTYTGDNGAPSLSLDGTKIVFPSNRAVLNSSEIFSMNSDGTDVQRLTENTASDASPSWSPDGSKIAFVSYRDGNPEIYVMDADGSNQTRLTNNTYSDFTTPSWSPDGTQLAFTSYRGNGYRVYVMNADGSNQRSLLPAAWGNEWYPAWSPDGTRIAFYFNSDIYTAKPNGTDLKRLTENNVIDAWMTWSPDSSKIAFTTDRDGDYYSIYVMNSDGSNQVPITFVGGYNCFPSWGAGSVQSATGEPTADAQLNFLYEDQSKALTLTGSDPADASLTYSIVSNPNYGTLSGTAPNLTYTPNPDFYGWDSFLFKVNNGTKDSYEARISLYVNFVNDVPTITSISDQSIVEEDSTGVLPFTIADDMTLTSNLTVTASSDNTTLFPQNGITLGGSGANRTIQLTPAPNQNGTANITVKVAESSEVFSTTAFKVTVQPVNDVPTISTVENQTINEDSSSLGLNFTVGDNETSAANLTVAATSSNQQIFDSNSITFSGQGANRTVTLLPRSNANGLATVTLKVTDEAGAIAESSFVVTVQPMNDAPIALNQTFSGAVKEQIYITLPTTNVDGDELIYEVVSTNLKGVLTGTGATRVFTATDPGVSSLTFRVHDTQGTVSNIATITINVTAPVGFKVSGSIVSYKPNLNSARAEGVSDVVIRLEQKGLTRYTLTSEGGSEYSVFGVAPGEYVARVYSVNGGRALPFDPLYQAVKVKKGNEALKPFALYSVFGQVTATVGSGKNKTVVPVSGATVNASMPVSGSSPIVVAVTTDSNGFYEISGFPKGKVTLLVGKVGVTMPSKGKYTVSLPSNSKPNKPNARFDIRGTASSSFNNSVAPSIQKS